MLTAGSNYLTGWHLDRLTIVRGAASRGTRHSVWIFEAHLAAGLEGDLVNFLFLGLSGPLRDRIASTTSDSLDLRLFP